MTTNPGPGSGPNAEQSDYWNGPETDLWVTEDRFDRMLAPFATVLLDGAGTGA